MLPHFFPFPLRLSCGVPTFGGRFSPKHGSGLEEQGTSLRYEPDRLKAAQMVQLRDAEPLIRLESLISALSRALNAVGGAIILSAEEDVPIALYGDIPFPIQLTEDEEDILFGGEDLAGEHLIIRPFFQKECVVGYIALRLSQPIQEKGMEHALMEAYATLTSKELELADKTAKLQYQNERVTRKQRQLEQAIAFKNNILSLTTHDLRSPITAIAGYLDLLGMYLRGENVELDEIKDFHRRLRASIDNVSDLVDQLNEIALLELHQIEMNMVKVDLNWVTQEICDVMQGPAIAKHQKLHFQRWDKPLYVEVDIPKAKRILFNLIGNAIKYTHGGGDITIRIYAEKGMAHVAIQDTGIGIPKEKVKAIFEPFHKLSKTGTNGEVSTGLGLFTCHYFTQLFKGSISVESEIDKGSTFCLHLPLASVSF